MAKRTRPPASMPDWHLWLEVARTIAPLKPGRRQREAEIEAEPLPLPPQPPGPVKKPPVRLAPMPPYQSDGRPQRGPGHAIEPRMRRRLGRGQIEIDGTIDLHGMRQTEAQAALTRFIEARSARGDRTVLVITGKGLKKVDGDPTTIVERGVLRSMLPIWLSDKTLGPLVAGWDQAAQGHGGEGAWYVRLRRRREQP